MASENRDAGMGGAKPPVAPQAAASALFNWITALGLLFTVLGILGAAGLFAVDSLAVNPPAYLGMLYIPAILMVFLGLLLVPVGYLLAKRKRARGKALRLPLQINIDLTIPRHRYVLLGALVGGVVALIVTMVGSFQAYQGMETNTFCGQTCHSVMSPEATAHTISPHARIRCVECHIGSGVEHYLHSKTSGMRRMAALVTGRITRPIPTPIADMRPARETCEECHWSSRFIGYKEKVRTYYASGEKSPEHKMRMLLKIGGGDSTFIKGFGIHYHMQTANKVEYIAKDRQRQEIGWVRVTRADGTVTEFTHEEVKLTDDDKKKLPVRRMDCLDCHNRPAHEFKSPVDAVDEALAAGKLSRKLPHIKVRSVKAIDGKYESTDLARQGIAESITNFYKDDFPDLFAKEGALIKQTVGQLQGIYEKSFFPEMKANWSAYPDNIGHRDWPGCFRCHTTLMKTKEDKPIFTDCTKCHLILAQGPEVDRGGSVNFAKGKTFDHPGYGDVISEYSKCIDCHTGGADLY